MRGDMIVGGGVQMRLREDAVRDYWRYGYWTTEEFLPDMYAEYYMGKPNYPKRRDGKVIELPKDDVRMVRFRGLVATGRPYDAGRRMKRGVQMEMGGGEKVEREKVGGKVITFFTVGVDNGEYLDLVLWGKYPVRKIHCIEGEGMVMEEDKSPWVQVTRFRFGRI